MATKQLVKQYIEFCNKNNIKIQTHQIYGVLWCIRKERIANNANNKWKGGVLADDMGMGKTIQMIATILLNFKKKTLILLPPILIQQWYDEILKFLGHSSLIYHGKYKNKNKKICLENATIVITSYDTFLRSPELLEISWNRTICDEAHRLRNPKTKLYKYIQQQLQTDIFWCISGTPIHNKIKDIMSLFSFFVVNIKAIPKNSSIPFDMILRRTKINNIILPIKTEFQEIISWTNMGEWKLAKDIHSSMGFSEIHSDTSFWKTKNMNELVTMIRAKQLCILPKLLEKPLQKIEIEEPDDLFPEYFKTTSFQNTSCKLNALIQHILSPNRNENGKIIFCHFQLEMTKIMELLRETQKQTLKQTFWIGNWKEFLRRNSSDNKTPILILQIRAGCEGLNLQKEFSDVYFVSPNWNPTLEDQAIARCHRIGQQKKVSVFRFYMDYLHSKDEIMMEKQQQQNIITYCWIIQKIPDDIIKYIDEFLVNDVVISKPLKFSMDLYILSKQNQKRKKITEFMDNITML